MYLYAQEPISIASAAIAKGPCAFGDVARSKCTDIIGRVAPHRKKPTNKMNKHTDNASMLLAWGFCEAAGC